jgi:pSer/pThr/pTyr-binding forkhead associated (FHA) protein
MELFLEACGVKGPLTLEAAYHGRHTSIRRSLYQPFALVGRDQRGDFRLVDPEVRKRHAYLHVVAGRTLHIDLQSQSKRSGGNGGKRATWLESSSGIRVGPYNVRLAESHISSDSSSDGESTHLLNGLPEIALRITEREGNTLTCSMAGIVALLGSSLSGPVGIGGRTVSDLHCILIRTHLGLWVVDLLGRGGTWVNGIPVRYARVEDGDRVSIGKYVIDVSYNVPLVGLRQNGRSFRQDEASGYASEDTAEDAISLPQPVLDPDLAPPARVEANAIVPSSRANGVSTPVAVADHLVPIANVQLISQEQLLEVLAPFATQFRLMQQQMFEQFQESLLTMFDMFGALQREQTGTILQELADLKRITREIQELRKEMAQRSIPLPQMPVPATFFAPSATTVPTAETATKGANLQKSVETIIQSDENHSETPFNDSVKAPRAILTATKPASTAQEKTLLQPVPIRHGNEREDTADLLSAQARETAFPESLVEIPVAASSIASPETPKESAIAASSITSPETGYELPVTAAANTSPETRDELRVVATSVTPSEIPDGLPVETPPTSVPPLSEPVRDSQPTTHESNGVRANSPSEPGSPDHREPRTNEAIHDWLSQRMLQLQREQQSRWQRLLRLLTGR